MKEMGFFSFHIPALLVLGGAVGTWELSSTIPLPYAVLASFPSCLCLLGHSFSSTIACQPYVHVANLDVIICCVIRQMPYYGYG